LVVGNATGVLPVRVPGSEGICVIRVQALQCKVTVQEIDPILNDVIVLHNDVKRNLYYGGLAFLNDSNWTCE
jgi:hypothetical protein